MSSVPLGVYEALKVETEEFVQWWESVRPHVLKTLRRYGTPVDSISDLEQDLAYIAWGKRSTFVSLEQFHLWLVKRARWLALDELRANQQARRFFTAAAEGEQKAIDPSQEHSVVLYEVLEAINQLPPQQRLVVLGMLEGKDDKGLAKELNVDEGTVRSLKRFGRAKLRSIVGGD
jgi:RNA polymerase sigma factor (sigma-70 family)